MLRAPVNSIAFEDRMHVAKLMCVVVVIALATGTAAAGSVPDFERPTLTDAWLLMLERNRERVDCQSSPC